MSKYIFTPYQQSFIKDNYLKISIKGMSRQLGIDSGVISRFMKKNGLSVSDELRKEFKASAMRGKTNFSSDDDLYVKNNYLLLPIKNIAANISRSYTGVILSLKRQGLTLPEEVKQRNINAGRIRKGNISHNKGKKQSEFLTPVQIARTIATRFKKGQTPHNAYDSDGIITVRHSKGDKNSYKYIRVSIGNWQMLHKHNWEAINGPVPDGYLLRCRNDDTMNCEPDNWEIITMGENYSRNSGNIQLTDKAVARYLATQNKRLDRELQQEILKYPELIELKRNQLLLNRAINEKI